MNRKEECCPENKDCIEETTVFYHFFYKEQNNVEAFECSDPEIEAWLNEGDKNEKEVNLELQPLVDHIDEKDCDETRSMAVIENQSEVAYHDDGDMCIISDSMIAKIMKNMGKKKKSDMDMLDTIDEMDEEEIKPKKLNRNSRSQKKAREERKLEAQKAKEEREQKEREQLKQLSQKPVSKYTFERPTKKTSSSLLNLAMKQKKAKKQ